MDQTLVASIRKSLEAKSTAELRQAYETRDQAAWSPEAFEAMRQLLDQRQGPGGFFVAVCPSCKSPMQSLGQLSLRVGGMSGGWHLLLGPWADASEGLLPLDVYRCSSCKRVEFFDLDDRLSKEEQT